MGRHTKFFVRKIVVAIGFLVASFAGAQEASSKFDFKYPAAPASVVLAELSKVAGANLVASVPVANDVILLNLKGVTLADTMTKIAEAIHGEWRKEGSGMVLYRGQNFEAADLRQETAEKVAVLKEEIQKLLTAQKTAGAFDEKAAKKAASASDVFFTTAADRPLEVKGLQGVESMQAMGNVSPSARAIVSLLSKMTDAQLGQLVNRQRIVFTSSPTRMQSPLPGGSGAIVSRFLQDQLLLQDAKRKNEKPQEEGGRQIFIANFGGDTMGDGDPKLGIGHTMLISQKFFDDDNLNLSLTLSDPNGRGLCSGSLSLRIRRPNNKPSKEFPTDKNQKPIKLSPLSEELCKALYPRAGEETAVAGVALSMPAFSISMVSDGGSTFAINTASPGGKTPKLSDELRERILNPHLFDPLSFAPSDALLDSANQLNKNLVAYLPDVAFGDLTSLAASNKITPSAFLNGAQTRADLDVKESNDWLVVSPHFPSSARQRTVNRVALGSALRTLNKEANLTLDQLAKFAASQAKEPRHSEIDHSYFRLIDTPFAGSRLDAFAGNAAWKTLQLYDSFSLAQKQTLAESGRLPLAQFTDRQIANLADQVFNSFDGPQVNLGEGRRGMTLQMFGQASARTERTIVLPNGLLRDGYLEVTNNTAQGVQAKISDSDGSQFMTLDTLAFMRWSQDDPRWASISGSNAEQPDLFRPAQQRQFSLRFHFTPQVSLNRQLIDASTSNQSYGAYDKLPESVRKQIQKKIEDLRKSMQGGDDGGTPPP